MLPDGLFAAMVGAIVVITAVVVSLAWWLMPKLWAWLMPIIHAATA